jgi:hypothetical protein
VGTWSWDKEGRDVKNSARGKGGGAWGQKDQATWRGVSNRNVEGVRNEEGGIRGHRSGSAPSETGRVARRAAWLTVREPRPQSKQ